MRITLSGYYGHGNIGDEAILLAIAAQLSAHELVAVSLDQAYTKRLQGLSSVDFFDLAAVEETVESSDMVIMGGGGLFQEVPGTDYYETSVSRFLGNPYGKPQGNLTAFATIPFMAAVYDKPLVILAHGLGPFHSPRAQRFYAFVLSLSSLITVRDAFSMDWARRLCPQVPIFLSGDPAFLLTGGDDTKAKEVLSSRGVVEGRFITLSLRDLLHRGEAETVERAVAAALNRFLPACDLTVLFVPFQATQTVAHPTDDRGSAERVRRLLDPAVLGRFAVVDADLHPRDVLTLMGKAHFCIGMRYHSLIFSLLHSVPCVALSYAEKCRSLMRDFGLEDLSIDTARITPERLVTHMNDLSGSPDRYRSAIGGSLAALQRRASLSFSMVETVQAAGGRRKSRPEESIPGEPGRE